MPRPFSTIRQTCESRYEEKRSVFIAYLYPISEKQQSSQHYEQLKQQHPDARHHCSAYIIGDPEQVVSAGFNDDGEPSGTAGKPMLNVLMQRKVGNVFAVVVRYFGGIKLGAGGLTRAYGQAVSNALDLAEFVTVEPQTEISVNCGFATEERVRHILTEFNVKDLRAEYKESVTLIFTCDDKALKTLQEKIIQISSGQATLKILS